MTKAELEAQLAYKNLIVGRHRLDIVVEDEVIIELKAVSGIAGIHIAQALSYMKAAGSEIGLIINFGEESLVWRRLIRKPRRFFVGITGASDILAKGVPTGFSLLLWQRSPMIIEYLSDLFS